ncbi:MAG: adenylosuccinate lyase [Gammaproteobacteria bacterium]|nr:adenylosuccinate lyase [Gammaproteobacteria bacterium]
MELLELTAISPADGRYAKQTAELREIFSEFGLMRRRLLIEIEWFKFLGNSDYIAELGPFSKSTSKKIDAIATSFSIEQASDVKVLEKKINHDLKAIEYFIKSQFESISELKPYKEFVHFSCTSEDINNLAYGLMLKEATENSLIPRMEKIVEALSEFANKYSDKTMISRTHGQAASPTTMGKELANYVSRLSRQLRFVKSSEYLGKFNGAVGNYNAHTFAYPEVDWIKASEKFVSGLGLKWNAYSTQIEPHDSIAELFQTISRFNTILDDLCKDIWSYVSIGYFTQQTKEGEVGSSTMPHKVNPIDFENAEGNLGLANAISAHFSSKLPSSRYQRDLSDSTVLRNLGLPFVYSLIAYNSIVKGLSKIELNEKSLEKDLEKNWEVLAEAIQTIMRKQGMVEPYEQLKKMTRGNALDKENIRDLIKKLDLPSNVEKELLDLTPESYAGQASKLTQLLINR